MRHRNIPIFIPHLGCPNQCVFCNQRSISGCHTFREESVGEQIERALSTVSGDDEVEIAFFGGSFTGIPRDLMLRLLDTAEAYVKEGRVSSIRLSTRPDYINGEILQILSRYSVREIELGLQSMSDEVLLASKRGHTARDAERACRAVVAAGFQLTGQMMIGLPRSTRESEIATARTIAKSGAAAVRIYPTVVFYGTPLCDMAKSGDYEPLTIEEAVVRCADVLEIFESAQIPCIRLGLCATEELTSDDAVYAGPNHPALGEMVLGELAYRRICALLRDEGLLGGEVLLTVPVREVSRTVGYKRANLERLYTHTHTRVRVAGAPVAHMTATRMTPSNTHTGGTYIVPEIT
ncbi:MAG: radical SAM protein [Clostridia bacterium]|nr:radical SAM protein [Clostridia bacterium]